jgi:hypothetical protein
MCVLQAWQDKAASAPAIHLGLMTAADCCVAVRWSRFAASPSLWTDGVTALARVLLLVLSLVAAAAHAQDPAGRVAPVLRLAIDQDYYQGRESLDRVAADFALVHRLSVGILRPGIGWDDTNPRPDRYTWGFWSGVVARAQRAGIAVRPYYAFTPAWAAAAYNAPPRNDATLARACGVLGAVIGGAVPTLEIWNEPDNDAFWNGTAGQFGRALDDCAAAIRQAPVHPRIVLGGLVYLDSVWLARSGAAAPGSYDIAAFHEYSETPWAPITVEQINSAADYDQGYDGISQNGAVAVWMNEGGASTDGRLGYSEATQASWIRRTFASVIGHPGRPISLFGLYQLRDLDPALSQPIGDKVARQFFLHTGLFTVDGRPKLGAATYADLARLFDGHRPALQSGVAYQTVDGHVSKLFRLYAWRLESGRQVVMLWDRQASSAGTLVLADRGHAAFLHKADGSVQPVRGFDGHAIDIPVLQAGGMPLLYEIR